MSMKKNILLAGLTILVGQSVLAQDYIKKFSEPQKLPASVNSADHEESYPIVSPDGKKLYFVRTFGSDEGDNVKGDQNVFTSTLKGGKWEEATDNVGEINNQFNNAVVGVSKDGERLYVLNQHPTNKRRTAKGVSLVEKSELEDESNGEFVWAYPQTIVMPNIEFQGDHYGVFVTPDERVAIFTANIKGGAGEEDLFVALQDEDGRWMELKSMGAVNSSKADFAPFLSPDKKLLFFSSYGHKSKGSADIFVSERLDDTYTNWSTPENLGDVINTKGFDGYLYINKDNEIIFASNRGKKTLADLYSSKLTFEEVIPEPTEPEVTELEKAVEMLKSEYNLSLIYFETGKHEVKAEDAIVLDAVSKLMNDFPEVEILLVGHTDNVGSEKSNERLSNRRANAARKYLESKGVDKNRVHDEFKGETEPIATNDTKEGRAKNRRVSITVVANVEKK